MPARARDASRLLVIDRVRAGFEDHGFAELPELLRSGDCLVVNNSRAIPARVLARDAGARWSCCSSRRSTRAHGVL
jgi:S-adenosylmethionine:tRNA ribosyltransferase-isomerase